MVAENWSLKFSLGYMNDVWWKKFSDLVFCLWIKTVLSQAQILRLSWGNRFPSKTVTENLKKNSFKGLVKKKFSRVRSFVQNRLGSTTELDSRGTMEKKMPLRF